MYYFYFLRKITALWRIISGNGTGETTSRGNH